MRRKRLRMTLELSVVLMAGLPKKEG